MHYWTRQFFSVFGLLCFLFCCAPFPTSADELTELITGKAAEPSVTNDKVIAKESSKNEDRKIQQRLTLIFAELESLQDITLSVSQGVVTLQGKVDTASAESKALQLASQVEGVVEVQNQLVVTRSVESRLESTLEKFRKVGLQLAYSLPLFLLALLVFAVMWLAGKWISNRKWLTHKFAPNAFIANLIGQFIHAVFMLSGLVLALNLLDATALLGTILGAAGLVGLAVGFAVKDTVENYIASIFLSLRNPFEENDFVNIDGMEGNVARLTSRAAILISPDGNHIRIPNSTVFKAVIINYTRKPERRFQFQVGISTEQDLVQAQSLALQTLVTMEGVLDEPKPLVLIEKLGDSNVELLIYAWVDQSKHSFGMVRSEAIRLVKKAFDSAGISMPEPIFNLHISESGSISSKKSEQQRPKQASTMADVRLSQVPATDMQDVSADRTVEQQVAEEQILSDGVNLLDKNAPQE
ncbi:mechanosensitive ion channel family protein [Desulfogranum japonicum]|uniref:mechanosensitive ion channel family protein n=1 Tax=Desulfogranum japonicum TaxID=231447 RepID=UPI00040132DD|nr:mechanosensitive ion channel family protein [Desulfogranum japonicum]